MKVRKIILVIILGGLLFLSFSPPAYCQPAAPSDVVAFPQYGSVTGIVIRWMDNATDETGFQIERRVGAGPWALVGSPPAHALTGQEEWLDSSLAPDTLYSFRIKAVNAAGDSAWVGPTEETQMPSSNFWARSDGVRDIMNIWSGSAIWNGQMFHEGIDFHAIEPVPTPPPDVQAVRGGVMVATVAGGQGDEVAIEVKTGSTTTEYDYYLHMQDVTAKGPGDQIAPGEYLGRISLTAYDADARHAHLSKLAANTPPPNLFGGAGWPDMRSPWLWYTLPADLDPFGNNPHLLDQSGGAGGGADGRTVFAVEATAAGNVKDPVRGDVDLLIEAYDDMNTTLAYENNVSALGYWVESQVSGSTNIGSAGSPLRLFNFDDTWFADFVPIRDKFDDVFDMSRAHGGSISKRGHYIATSATTGSSDPGDADGSKFWRTRARTGSGTAPYYESASLARHNGEARFKDGNYTVHVLMSDQVHIDIEETQDITLDNWLPYVVSVQIQGADILSHAQWVFNPGTGMMEINYPSGSSDIIHAGNNENDITFTITFSEPLTSATLSIPGVTWGSTSVTLSPNADSTVWSGTLTGAPAPAGTDPSGIYYLYINGQDSAGNSMSGRTNFTSFDPGVDLDPDSGATGDDSVHRFVIATKRDIALVLDRSGSMAGATPGFTSKMAALIDAGNIFLDILIPSTHTNLAGIKYDDVIEALCPTCTIGPMTATQINDIRTGINGLTPRNATSIGGALTEAANQLSTVGDEKNLVLLFTDGKHNTAPSVTSGLNAIHALTPNNTTISAIGFGTGTQINIPQLQTIVSSTNGDLWTTGSGLELHKFFLEALMNAGGTPYSIFISDPETTIHQGETKEHPFTIDYADRQIAVVVEWGNTSGVMDVYLRSPNNQIINMADAVVDPRIQFTGGTSYALYQLSFPLGGSESNPLLSEWRGTWHIVVDASDSTAGSHQYSYSVISSSELSVQVEIVGKHITGEKVFVLVKLLYKNKPIQGRLSAIIDYPAVSKQNVLKSFDVPDSKLDLYKKILMKKRPKDYPLTSRNVYNYAVEQIYGKDLKFPRKQVVKRLAQVDQFKDKKLGPGNYMLELPDTDIAGDYRITVLVNSAGYGRHSPRMIFKTHVIRPSIDFDRTKIKVYSERDLYFLEKRKLQMYLEITPQDRYGNLLGPGLLDTGEFSLDLRGLKVDSIADRGDGTYVVSFTPIEKMRQIPLQIKILDKKLNIVVRPKGKILRTKK